MKRISISKPLFPKKKKPQPVLQDWVLYLPPIVQSDLLKSLRGCDSAPSPDYSKFLIKEIRKDTMKDASYEHIFFKQGGKFKDNLNDFLRNIDKYNLHFFSHLLESVKILAYCHEEEKVRNKWLWIQMRIYGYLNINPETPTQMKKRYGEKKKRFQMGKLE